MQQIFTNIIVDFAKIFSAVFLTLPHSYPYTKKALLIWTDFGIFEESYKMNMKSLTIIVFFKNGFYL